MTAHQEGPDHFPMVDVPLCLACVLVLLDLVRANLGGLHGGAKESATRAVSHLEEELVDLVESGAMPEGVQVLTQDMGPLMPAPGGKPS